MYLGTRTREWARLGAATRLIEIDKERAEILREFPDLRGTSGRLGVVAGRRAPRPKLSAAARRRLSAGMRRYWARRKARAGSARTQSK